MRHVKPHSSEAGRLCHAQLVGCRHWSRRESVIAVGH